jgi:phenylalanyl-tRNA synthetase beta chain
MRFNVRWLLEYVDLDLPVSDILNGLTMSGLEVESYLDVGLVSGRIVVGEILEILPHGSAKKLYICRVRISNDPKAEPLRIVCGAPGIKVGDRVPVALPGAVLQGGRTIERTAVRGEMSDGMLCSGAELGWNSDGSCLLLLDSALPLGEPIDGLVEVAVTPNRPDCLSLVGIARDLAAYFHKPFHLPKFRWAETTEMTEWLAKVATEDKEGCPRYTARIVRNVHVGPSPAWLARAIEVAGLRSINNIVDVTNYVLMELGHPLHAFDLDKIAGHEIIVRRAREGEKLRTLDGVERDLTTDDLLITDPSRPIALAGIMGGENTEISDATVSVLLESAYFDPVRIRRTRRRLDIQTDASFRFERGTDRENVHVALNRAAQLIREVAGGEITKGFIDVVGARSKPQPVTLRTGRANDILGVQLDGSEIADILVRIGCEIAHSDHHQLIVVPPTHRVDLLREIDLIEEIGRLYGYDKIEATIPYVPARPAAVEPAQQLREQVASLLVAQGLTEVVTYSFTDRESIERARQTTEGVVELVNPLSRGQSVLRTSLVPTMLATIAYNQKRGNVDLALCEVAKSYHWKGGATDIYQERDYALAALAGCRPSHWSRPVSPWDFFDIKGIAENVLSRLGIVPDRLERLQRPELHPGRSAAFLKGDSVLCVFGQIHLEVAEAWEIRGEAFLAQFDLEALAPHTDLRRSFREIGQYPAVVRDLALLVDSNVPAGEIEATLRAAGGELLESLVLFDVYEGERIGAGKRSLAYSLTFRTADRTLTEKEVNEIQRDLLTAVAKKHGAQLRQA